MNEQTPETPLDDAALERLRADARAILTGEKLSQKAIADEAGIPPGTFNAWLSGSYAGDVARVGADVARWLDSRRERNRIKAIVPVAPSYIPTKTAQKIVNVCQYAQTLRDMGLVIGSPGTGKTCAVEYYQAAHPNVFMATMEPAKSSVHHVLLELATLLRLSERSALAISDAIVRRLKGRDALLLIDEAQHLNSSAIDQLRTIHDKARCGVVLLGNESIVGKLGDAQRTPQLAQLYSRFGLRETLQRPLNADIDALLKAWGVDDRDEKAFMRLVAGKPGGLRALTKTMIAAGAMAAGNDEPRSIAHLKDAWSRVGAGPIGNG
jgi:DNA transposition AAA+ family ATPase